MRLNMKEMAVLNGNDIKAVYDKLMAGELSKGAAIRELFAGGLSVKEISIATGIKYNHVYNVVKAEVVGLHLEKEVIKGREGGTKKDKMLKLLQEGKTVMEVSQELGCLYNQVWQVAKAAGLTKKQQEVQA